MVGRGATRARSAQDPTAHAELLAVAEAARTLGRWRLTGVTAVRDPGALRHVRRGAGARAHRPAGLRRDDPKAGAVGSLIDSRRTPGSTTASGRSAACGPRSAARCSATSSGRRRSGRGKAGFRAWQTGEDQVTSAAESWPSGRRRLIRNQVYRQGYRGFESLALRLLHVRSGEVTERPKVHDWKSCVSERYRGFESHPLRQLTARRVRSVIS